MTSPTTSTATKQTQGDDWRVRQAGYNQTGVTYSLGNYGSRLGRAYLKSRTELLTREVDAHFGATGERDLLEIGCGTGLTLELLGQNPRWRLHGMDFSSTMLAEVAQRARGARHPVRLCLGNAIELPFADESFDVIYATRFIHQFPHADKLRIAAEIERVLRPGGLVALEFYARALNHVRYYTTQRGKYPTRELYFLHYPSRDEVREIVGPEHSEQALRYVGDRLINRVLGYRAYSLVQAQMTRVPGARLLTSEHWIFYTPERRKGPPRPPCDASPEPFAKLRCPTCHGPLSQAATGELLTCAPCRRGYAIQSGVPDLLSHEARDLDQHA